MDIREIITAATPPEAKSQTNDRLLHWNSPLKESEEIQEIPSIKPEVHRKEIEIEHGTERNELLYLLHDTPAWYTSAFLGIQHCFLAIGSLIGVPLILAKHMCMGENDEGYLARAMVLNTLFFISGISTFLQATFGSRLPILQGASFSFLPSAFAILALPHNECPTTSINATLANESLLYRDTDGELVDDSEVWMKRMRQIQGAIAVASVFEILLGLTGAMGFLTRFIGPLTVASAISLIGLSLIGAAANNASAQWGVAMFTIVVLVLFSQYLRNRTIPLPFYTRQKGFHVVHSNFIKLFPVLITIVLAWILCLILTVTGALPDDPNQKAYRARTDVRISVLNSCPWIRFPYPGQWGLPIVSVAGVVGMLAAVLCSIIESIGDYYACARICGAPPVPRHALNRGIAIEGLGCLLAGVLGTGSGTSSYSVNIGAIAITRVASRRVMQMAGAFFFLIGLVGKFGAVLVSIPDPIVGGMFCVLFGYIASVGLSNLQHVNLNSPRNLFVIGFSLFVGLMVPTWVRANESSIDTGAKELDQILIVLLETSIFVGGSCAAFFDNTLPGTLEERGMVNWRKITSGNQRDITSDEYQLALKKAYDLPFPTNYRFSKFIPVLPEFDGFRRKSRESA